MHAAHPEFVPAVVVLDPPLPGTAAMTRNEADRAGAAPYERAPAQQRRLDGEGGGGRTERAVAAGRRGRRAGGGGMERVAAGARRGWADGIGVSVGGQHVGCEIRPGMGIGSVGA